jgi:DNA-directed RNA polymerase subunit RPC12/RpoP
MWLRFIGAYLVWIVFGIVVRYVLDECTYDPYRCSSCGTAVTPQTHVCPECSTRLGKHERGLFG